MDVSPAATPAAAAATTATSTPNGISTTTTTTANASSPETALREKLKIALQDAKRLFDDNLIDEDELKDLKAHEICKYKRKLDSLATATTTTATTVALSPAATSTDTPRPITPIVPSLPPLVHRTPPFASIRRYRGEDEPPAPFSAPPAIRKRRRGDPTIYVEPEIYQRLTTPPIFRRRPRAKRRIVVRTADLAAFRTG